MFEAQLRRVEAALDAVEALPPSSRDVALDALHELLALYGTAFERMLRRVDRLGDHADPVALAEDELVGHLLMVHGLHPLGFEDPTEVPGAPGGPPLVQLGLGPNDREGGAG